jgi:hypothetical protein
MLAILLLYGYYNAMWQFRHTIKRMKECFCDDEN